MNLDPKISKALEAMQGEFDWKDNNCALSVANAYEAITGVYHASEYADKCTSILSAARVLKEEGGLPSIMRKLGFVEKGVNFAGRGDVVIFEFESRSSSQVKREALGIVVDYRAAFKDKEGVNLINVNRCSSAWSYPQN
jgi:hypothetical protein